MTHEFDWGRGERNFVYADCAASSPIHPAALAAVEKVLCLCGNPNSGHGSGREMRNILEEARDTIAECINADDRRQIAFTPSATSACHTMIDRFCNIKRLLSPFEHKAVSDHIEPRYGSLRNEPVTYIHMLANNETGVEYTEPVKSLSKRFSVLCDATAAAGHMPIDVKDLGVDALAAGAHKFGGVPGIGFLYARSGIEDADTFPGTPPVALAAAMAAALKFCTDHMVRDTVYLLEQRMNLVLGIINRIDCAHINCVEERRLPNIVSVRFDGVNARELITALDVYGVHASAGAACSSESDKPSPTLLASGLTPAEALSTIRLSFSPYTEPEEFNFVLEALCACVGKLKRLTV